MRSSENGGLSARNFAPDLTPVKRRDVLKRSFFLCNVVHLQICRQVLNIFRLFIHVSHIFYMITTFA